MLLAILTFRIIQSYQSNSSLENQTIPPTVLTQLNIKHKTSTKITLGSEVQAPYIIIYWSAHCPPCLVELARFNSALLNNEIPPSHFIAINLGDDLPTIRKFMQQKGYTFPVYKDHTNQLTAWLQVKATPLVVHVNSKAKINWMSSGFSPTGIIRAIKLFK